MTSRLMWGAFLAVSVIGVSRPAAAVPLEFAPVMLSGDPAPGTGGLTVTDFARTNGEVHPLVGNTGSLNPFVLLEAHAGTFPGSKNALYLGPQRNLTAIAVQGQSDPGLPNGTGVVFSDFRVGAPFGAEEYNTQGTLNNSGQFIFTAILSGTGVVTGGLGTTTGNDKAYYFHSGGTNTLLWREDDTGNNNTGTPSATPYANVLYDSALNNNGVALMEVFLAGGGANTLDPAIYMTNNGATPVKILAKGDTMPGGGTIDQVRYPHINDAGNFIFLGHTTLDDTALIFGNAATPGTLGVQIRTGFSAGQFLGGGQYDNLVHLDLGVGSNFVANVTLKNGAIDHTPANRNDSGITKGTLGGGMSKVVQTGDLVVDTSGAPDGSGNKFGLFRAAVINANSNVSFIAESRDGAGNILNGWGIYSDRPVGGPPILRRVVQTGDVVGGLTLGYMDDPIMNALNHIAFLSPVTAGPGGAATAANDRAIFAEIGGTLQVVAREGDPFQVAVGDVRTINRLVYDSDNANTALGTLFLGDGMGFVGGADGRGLFFNDSDQLVFWASFTDGSSGVFLANVTPIPVPEPAGLIAAALAGAGLFLRLRRSATRCAA